MWFGNFSIQTLISAQIVQVDAGEARNFAEWESQHRRELQTGQVEWDFNYEVMVVGMT